MDSQGDGLIGVEVITRQHQVTEEEARRKEKKEREDPQVLFFFFFGGGGGDVFSISTWKMNMEAQKWGFGRLCSFSVGKPT